MKSHYAVWVGMVLAALVMGCARVHEVYPVTSDRAKEIEGFQYALPLTVYRVNVPVTYAEGTPGKHADQLDNARLCLPELDLAIARGEYRAVQKPERSVVIHEDKITMEARGIPDPSKVYTIRIDQPTFFENRKLALELDSLGLVVTGQSDVTDLRPEYALKLVEIIAGVVGIKASGRVQTSGPSDFAPFLEVAPTDRIVKKAACDAVVNSAAKEAFDAMTLLFSAKNELLAAIHARTTAPSDALATHWRTQMQTIDEQLLKTVLLFTGEVSKTETTLAFDVVFKEAAPDGITLFTVDPKQGIQFAFSPDVKRSQAVWVNDHATARVLLLNPNQAWDSDITGTVYRLHLEKSRATDKQMHDLLPPDKDNGTEGQAHRPVPRAKDHDTGPRGMYYNRPASTLLRLSKETPREDGKPIHSTVGTPQYTATAQLGVTASLPYNVHGAKQVMQELRFDSATGAPTKLNLNHAGTDPAIADKAIAATLNTLKEMQPAAELARTKAQVEQQAFIRKAQREEYQAIIDQLTALLGTAE